MEGEQLEVESVGRSPGSDERDRSVGDLSVLVVTNHTNVEKIERHWAPLADVAGNVTMVCLNRDPEVDSITYRLAPDPGHRVVGITAMFFLSLWEGWRDDYDAVASISLFPYGLYALLIGTILGLPTHLGIIGSDLDRHAVSWYGPAVRAIFRRFAAISVPGTAHKERLEAMGVHPDRIVRLANAIDTSVLTPDRGRETVEFDLLWVGRLSPEKDPLLFVRGLGTLRDRGYDFDAVMAGDGELADAVRRERAALDLDTQLSLPGWVDEPREYYARSGIYVLTSRREGLPLTLLEAMAVGLPAVVPDVGSVKDPVSHLESGYVYEPATPEALADALETMLTNPGLRSRLAESAPRVRESFGYDDARNDWRQILAVMTRY